MATMFLSKLNDMRKFL